MKPLPDGADITVFVIKNIKYLNEHFFFNYIYYFTLFIERCVVRKNILLKCIKYFRGFRT